MGDASPARRMRRSLRRESVQVVVALVIGALLALALLQGVGASIAWRLAVLPLALLLVVRGLIGLVGLGRAEWRRDRPRRRAYVAVLLRFTIAYVIVVAATS